MYNMRSKNGFLIAKFSDYIGKVIIMKSAGHFEQKTFVSGNSHKCYVLDVDGTFFLGTEGREDYMKIYLWKGCYLYEAD